MTVDFIRDDLARQVTVAAHGTFNAEDWSIHVVDRLWREDVWTFGILYDLSGLTDAMTLLDVKNFVREGLRVPAATVRGPIAVVASTQDVYVKASAFASIVGHMLRVQVFHSVYEAQMWLGGQITSTRPKRN